MNSKCGTYSGYRHHKYKKENACDPCREAKRLHSQQWRSENKDLANAANQTWAAKNLEKVRAKNRAWNHANRDKRQEAKRKRRALEKGNLHEPYSVKTILEIYGSNCHICNYGIDLEAPRSASIKGYEFGLHVDHVIPLSKGGADNLENVRPSHAICNMKKGARHGAKV